MPARSAMSTNQGGPDADASIGGVAAGAPRQDNPITPITHGNSASRPHRGVIVRDSGSGPRYSRRNAVGIHDRGRMDIEGIGKPHEHIEQRSVVHGLRDRRVGPSYVSSGLDLF